MGEALGLRVSRHRREESGGQRTRLQKNTPEQGTRRNLRRAQDLGRKPNDIYAHRRISQSGGCLHKAEVRVHD